MEMVFRLSLRQLAGKRRLALIVLLAALPVVLAGLLALFGERDGSRFNSNFITVLVDGMIVAGVLPIVTMTLATAAFGNELEDRTLSYLTLKPIRRWGIVMPKFLASVVVGGD